MSELELGFSIKGYPGTGRKVEDEVDLATCDRFDLLQGAFMGDLMMRVGDIDFDTTFGWVTLVAWLLSLAEISRKLASGDRHVARFNESDDFMSFRRHGDLVFVACSYRPQIGYVRFDRLTESIREFIGQHFEWIRSNYPSAMANPAMADVLARIA